MKICYVSNHRLPSERAHGRQIANVCQSMYELGHTVDVVAPYRNNIVTESFWDYYKVSKKITLTILNSIDFITAKYTPGLLGLRLFNWSFTKHLRKHLQKHKYDCFYTRTFDVVPSLVGQNTPIILELHSIPQSRKHFFVRCCNQSTIVACLTQIMAKDLVALGVQKEKITVEPDAVELEQYAELPTTSEARQIFGVETNRVVVGYVGRLKTLGMDKGIKDLLLALKLEQSTKKFVGLIVGGPTSDQLEYKALAERLELSSEDVLFIDTVEHAMVPKVLAACDILAMPWPNKRHYRRNMSPLKMFEYMAAKKPILTGDLPTIREILDENMAVFCEPDNPDSIVQKLNWITDHPLEAEARVQSAYAAVQNYTWQKRTERLLCLVDSYSK